MKKWIKFTCFTLSAFISISSLAQPSPQESDMIKSIMSDYMQENKIPGAAVLIYANGAAQSYYFGVADKKHNTPVTQKTIFELGSITKVMTSLLLAEEVDMSRMQLTDSVKKYFPTLPSQFDAVTLQTLATHTSSLPFSLDKEVYSSAELQKALTNESLSYAANEKWRYSNLGIGILGAAIEQVTKKNIQELYVKQILSPLGMQPIGITVPKQYKKFVAQGYSLKGLPVTNETIKPMLSGAGDAKASAGDMQHFLAASIGLPGTPEKIFYPMRMTQSVYVKLPDKSQGLGWEIHEIDETNIEELVKGEETGPVALGSVNVIDMPEKPTFDGNALIDKTGATKGFRTYIALIPNKKSGIVILTNRSATDQAIASAGREILFRLTKII